MNKKRDTDMMDHRQEKQIAVFVLGHKYDPDIEEHTFDRFKKYIDGPAGEDVANFIYHTIARIRADY